MFNYSQRFDTAAHHASFINANSKGKRYTVRHLIGDVPLLSDQKRSIITADQIKKAFEAIFPNKTGVVGEKRVERNLAPKE